MKALENIRNSAKKLMNALARSLNKWTGGRLHPDVITVIGFLMHLPIAILIARGSLVLAALLLIVFGLFDALDGALAREQKRSSNTGMFLDSMTDKIKEVVLYIGIALFFASNNETTLVVWTTAAAGVSILISYANAWGEVAMSKAKISSNHATNKSFRSGLMQFDIRMSVLVLGLIFGLLNWSLYVIVVLGAITLFDRIQQIMQRLRRG